MTKTSTPIKKKMFLDIPTAAELAGFSVKGMRIAIQNDKIPIVPIKRKFFILGRDFEIWQKSKKSKK